jgi:hypothetical protein
MKAHAEGDAAYAEAIDALIAAIKKSEGESVELVIG